MPRDAKIRPPKDLFAVVPSADEKPPANSDHVSVTGVFLEPGLQELSQYQDDLQGQLGIEHLNLDCQPRIRLIFLQHGGQEPITIPDSVEEWDESIDNAGHQLTARVLGAKHSATQLSCDCEFGRLKITICFAPFGDDALLYNKTGQRIFVESVPNDISVFEVLPQKFATIYPGCWRVRDDKASMQFRLRPRRYRLVLREDTAKRTAGQITSSKRINHTGAVVSRRAGFSEGSVTTASRQVGNTGLGIAGLRQRQTLNMIDEVTGKLEYSIKFIDKFSGSSRFHVFKAILDDGSSPAQVVAVKMPKLGEEAYLSVANDMLKWQNEVRTHRDLRHVGSPEFKPSPAGQTSLLTTEQSCIASLLAFDARLLSLMVEYKDSHNLADPPWRTRQDYFKGDCNDACIIAADIASALAYLTEKGIVHNDIAPANILYNRDPKSAVGIQRPTESGAILIDFGESRSIKEQGFLRGGRPWYMPPEWVGGKRGLSADVWSLGIVMLYLLRRLRLPESSEPEWWISEIPMARPGSSALRLKLAWLAKVEGLRKGLKDPAGNVEGERQGKLLLLVGQMLDVESESRIKAYDLAEETRDWASA